MIVLEQLRYWGIGIAVFGVLLWVLADALLPFVLGAAIAYLTDPLADWLESHGLSRVLATVVITVVSIGTVMRAYDYWVRRNKGTKSPTEFQLSL